MTLVDWLAVALVLVEPPGGAAQGFVWSSLSLVGLAVGAVIGGRIAPLLLAGGAHSQYAPVIALAGAVTFALVFELLGSTAGAAVRRRERRFLREADSAAGIVAGALIGLVVIWVFGAMALQLPGQTRLRRAVQRSLVLRHLNAIVPPATILNALARIDPFPRLAGPPVPTQPPDPRVLEQPGVQTAAASVVRVLGTACGLGIEGSGWVARRGLVVTAAHVVAGETDTTVTTVSGSTLPARAVVFDSHNDVAVLRVVGLSARPLRLVDPKYGTAVAIVGYPEDGPFDAVPGRLGSTVTVLTQDAYGRGPVRRTVTKRSEERRVGKECRSRWSPYH